MAAPRRALLAPLLAFASRLRFPVLFAVTVTVFAIDVVFPDAIPFVDEFLLGLAAILLASWKKSRRGAEEDAPAAGCESLPQETRRR